MRWSRRRGVRLSAIGAMTSQAAAGCKIAGGHECEGAVRKVGDDLLDHRMRAVSLPRLIDGDSVNTLWWR
jgi:hypothetical protein